MNADEYAAIMNDSSTWLRTGQRLLASADLLWNGITDARQKILDLHERAESEAAEITLAVDTGDLSEFASQAATYQLLAGYAIENLLKAVRVRRTIVQGGSVVDAQGRLTSLPISHRFDSFAEQEFGVGQVSAFELTLLRRLTQAVLWAGRYPMDRRIPEVSWLTWGSDDADHVHALAERIVRLHDSLS